VLGNQSDAAAGYCGEGAFGPNDCQFNKKGNVLTCKP
jgi:hypothetical protein